MGLALEAMPVHSLFLQCARRTRRQEARPGTESSVAARIDRSAARGQAARRQPDDQRQRLKQKARTWRDFGEVISHRIPQLDLDMSNGTIQPIYRDFLRVPGA